MHNSTSHTGGIRAVAWSPDSCCLASASLDKSVQVWDVTTGYRYVTYTRHHDVVYRTAWSPDGSSLASTGYNGEVHLWEAMSGRIEQAYSGLGIQIASVSWSPDGQRLISGGAEEHVRIWERTTGQLVFTYSGHASPAPVVVNTDVDTLPSYQGITAVAWSPDGHWIASGDSANSI